jgi:hypothetical protein
MLAKLDWQDLNEVINQCFSDKTAQIIEGEWVYFKVVIIR